MALVIGVAVALVLYWFIILRPGRVGFWKLVTKNPDAAYDHFHSNACWVIFEKELPEHHRTLVPSAEWDGPFRLWVPQLGGTGIYVFGRIGQYERSQDELVQKLQARS